MIYLNTNKLSHHYALAIKSGLSEDRKSHLSMQLHNFVFAKNNELCSKRADKGLKQCIELILRENLYKGYHQVLILFSALKAMISEFTTAFKLSFIELYESITKDKK